MMKTKPLGTVDGFTPQQRFFVGWGQMWCENKSEEIARLHAQTNPQFAAESTGRRGSCRDSREFAKAFSCLGDGEMVKERSVACGEFVVCSS
jgi:predicted metalloendopeptidase